ncbi:GntR family transcriptional regulator [Streptomyces sp. NBC_01433]|uniref:GntR family transcriptional regulator n=1 Tax=Streptomyces sp. NBC_01433 TaxID=2903864 RepID=UPI0022556E7C|nr:GntR family transcriptional regulator [Streptomyces sp. NBC_01433]MCX4682498.1 GntR family transcriptional regulator [Streptomyces sp. NBC_01433]MCX4682551.1 GntR family transcriptional regulator [Streptomyces sp. NBC_01433]
MTKSRPPHDTTPRINVIAADLRSRIDAGEFPPGSKLPSTRLLAAHYEISGQAIARVVALLKAEGVVVGKQGSGVFVREWKPLVYRPQQEFKRLPPNVDIFTNLLSAEGRVGSQEIDITTEIPDEAIRGRLQLAEGEEVAARLRTRSIEGEIYNLNDSYVPLALVEGSDWMSEADVARGTNQVLADLGRELVKALDEIYVRPPKAAEVERLKLQSGTWVIEHIVTTFDRDDVPVQVTVNILAADRHVIVFERDKYPLPGEATDS